SPDSIADLDGRLQVGDILLKVNETSVSGLPRQTVIDLLRKARGTVQLTVCRSLALHWAYSGKQSTSTPCPTNTKGEPGSAAGSLRAQPVPTFKEEEEPKQMCTKDRGRAHNSPLRGRLAGEDHTALLTDTSDWSQRRAGREGCRRESQQSESGSWNEEEEDLSHRIPVLPRSNHAKNSCFFNI
ncbi:INADL protein, partial [Jacana jacana]|nr:INADL protein [Jacana jacana]